MNYLIIAIIVLVIVIAGIFNFLANNKIRNNGIEAEAEVSRIDIRTTETVDEDGMTDTDTTETYYVKYKNSNDEVIEAMLNNPGMGLKEGDILKIKYLKEKPKKVIRIK